MSESRQLAAIMFSDIEGYTRMMEVDEHQGRMNSKRYRTVLEEQLDLFKGTLINSYGDGSLCIFPSAVEAVRCAYAIQRQLLADPKVPLRIGLHVGDIVVEDQDLYGSGVNTASRIESMGVAGSVLLSATICREIKNHSEFRLKSLGFFEFKNIEQPLEVYALENEGLIVPKAATLKGKFKEKARKINPWLLLMAVLLLLLLGWLAGRRPFFTGAMIQSIAVLPFQSATQTMDQEILSAGLHDGLISTLGQLATVKVISKGSSLAYSGTHKSLKEISEELNVEGLVTGTVMFYGDSVRISLHLYKMGFREKELWAHTYTGRLNDILNLYQSVRSDIARKINVGLTTSAPGRNTAQADVNPETYKAFLSGMYFLNKSTPEEFEKGMQYLLDALQHDPADPRVYSGLAQGYAMMGHGPDPEDRVWRRAKAAALKAISLDSTIAEAHTVLAIIRCYYEWDWEGAEQGYRKALAINPNLALAHFQYAWYLACLGRWEEAIQHHKAAKELDPLTPIYTVDMANIYLWAGKVDDAFREVNEGLELDREFGHGWWTLGNVYVAKGLFDKAIEAHQKAGAINPIWRGALGGTYALAGQPEKTRAILEEYKSQSISPRSAFWIAYMHLTLGEYDEMFKWLDYEQPDPWVAAIRTWPEFRVVHKDPRFKSFIKRLHQPPI